MAEKRAYYLEIPDKDLCIMLMDDGEHQEVVTTHNPGFQEVWMDMLREKGFETFGFQRTWRRLRNEDDEFKTESEWHRLTGELVSPGAISRFGFTGSRDAGTGADYPGKL